MSIDYDELECEYCGHVGVEPDGDFDVVCPECGAIYSLLSEEDEES